ncbi:MAG: 23S rRNA (adenine(2503)-C(2))-methyltransferase RlmN [Bacteroidales bacterium]|nr:23S rRNA (adenine(2503)-C(2))-methyltransferase RlmN [Bacteroidales bacterium]
MKENLFGKTYEELSSIVAENSLPSYAGKQIADWLYKKRCSSVDEMTNIARNHRERLKEKFTVEHTPPADVSISSDGTRKYLFSTVNGRFIETAYIPENSRHTLCVSSQVGCKMGCFFCMTAKQGFQGNLKSSEILNQIFSIPESEKLTNIVYMGMGEPLDNLEEVLKSLDILTSDYGLAMSPTRITVSTIGLLPQLLTFIEKSRCHLAISLHNPFPEERKKIMPIESVHNINKIITLLKEYGFNSQRRVSFEYIMFRGLNDTARHINGLASLLNGLKCRINLIRFHSIPGTRFISSDDQTIEEFKNKLNKKGIVTTIRASRGVDILAACGLLSTLEMKKNDMKEPKTG